VAAAQAEVESARVEARRAREEERTFGGAAAKRVEVAKADATELNSLLQVRSQAHIEAPWTQTADDRRWGIACTAPQCASLGAPCFVVGQGLCGGGVGWTWRWRLRQAGWWLS
jgi:hypothetical protein